MKVYLLRHGDAQDRSVSGRDEDRELTPAGLDKLEQASRGWRRVLEQVDRVFCSSLIRARQTAEILHRTAEASEPIAETEQLVPYARPLETLQLLQGELQSGSEGVACVGHEPHMGALLGLLLTGNDHASIPFKKGQLVVVQLDSSASMLGRLCESLTQTAAAALE